MKPLALAILLALAVVCAPAAAVDDTKPVWAGCGKFGKDTDADGADPTGIYVEEAEIVNAFVKHDPSKAAEATTVNLTIKNLTGTVPPPATSLTYNAVYGGVAPDTTTFVRAHIDFAGQVVFEYGHLEPLAVSTRYAYDGPTTGKLFTGENGVAQIVIPPDAGGKAGAKLSGVTAQTQVGRTTIVPGAVSQSPSRGLSYQFDDAAIGSYTVEPCAAGAAPPPTTGPVVTKPSTTPSTQTESLPVKLLTKSLKKAKKGKKVGLRLRASETLKTVALRLSKGRRVFANGKLATLSGTKTVKVKLSKALAKGTYVLAVAGTDAKGARRVGSFKLKVK